MYAQFLVTDDTNAAAFGDLSYIVNLETVTICLKFESQSARIILSRLDYHSLFYKVMRS